MLSSDLNERLSVSVRRLHVRISYEDILRRQVIRLVEALHARTRMIAAGVPPKVREKIMRRYRPWPYALRREMAGLIADLRREHP